MLSVTMLSSVLLIVIMLRVVLLSVVNAGLLRGCVAVVTNLNLKNSTLITSNLSTQYLVVLSRPICESTKQVWR